jgi:hypothetical protein
MALFRGPKAPFRRSRGDRRRSQLASPADVTFTESGCLEQAPARQIGSEAPFFTGQGAKQPTAQSTIDHRFVWSNSTDFPRAVGASVEASGRLPRCRINDTLARGTRHERFVGLWPGFEGHLKRTAHNSHPTQIIARPLNLSSRAGREFDVSLGLAGAREMLSRRVWAHNCAWARLVGEKSGRRAEPQGSVIEA